MADPIPCEGCAFARNFLGLVGNGTQAFLSGFPIPPHRPDCPAAQTTELPGGVRVHTYAETCGACVIGGVAGLEYRRHCRRPPAHAGLHRDGDHEWGDGAEPEQAPTVEEDAGQGEGCEGGRCVVREPAQEHGE